MHPHKAAYGGAATSTIPALNMAGSSHDFGIFFSHSFAVGQGLEQVGRNTACENMRHRKALL